MEAKNFTSESNLDGVQISISRTAKIRISGSQLLFHYDCFILVFVFLYVDDVSIFHVSGGKGESRR